MSKTDISKALEMGDLHLDSWWPDYRGVFVVS